MRADPMRASRLSSVYRALLVPSAIIIVIILLVRPAKG
jgi:hypothetical protein